MGGKDRRRELDDPKQSLQHSVRLERRQRSNSIRVHKQCGLAGEERSLVI
jgi:hypothetical protein